jgi:hypothetical protein
MFWRATKFITLSEVTAWIVWLVVTVALGAFGLQIDKVGQTILFVCWFVLFVIVYRAVKRRSTR